MEYYSHLNQHIVVTVRLCRRGKDVPRRGAYRLHRGGDTRPAFKNVQEFTQLTRKESHSE